MALSIRLPWAELQHAGKELIAFSENLRQHAVRALEIAPVGYRNSQVPQGSAKLVCNHALPSGAE